MGTLEVFEQTCIKYLQDFLVKPIVNQLPLEIRLSDNLIRMSDPSMYYHTIRFTVEYENRALYTREVKVPLNDDEGRALNICQTVYRSLDSLLFISNNYILTNPSGTDKNSNFTISRR